MLFNSLVFLFLFLPVTFFGFRLCARAGHRFAEGWLVAVSLLFYGWVTPVYLVLLCSSVAFNYTVGVFIERTVQRALLQKAILAFGVTANLLVLGYFKYLFPLLHWIERYGIHIIDPNASILLPLGISFFTFTQIGYLIDCKASLTSGRRFLDYALFVTIFPHLIAGPILHHREMIPQFEDEETWRFDFKNILIGLSIFFIGLAKKDLVADYFGLFAKPAFDNPGGLTAAEAWCGALSYSMQLYFDFSGYSEMAIGLALLFNIRFPANFDSPYKSSSIIDFWQRFHMTLTRYLTLYLYNPIALWVTRRRTEKGRPVGRKGLRTWSGFFSIVAMPTFLTMTLIGIWHGAGIQFLVFGLLHAIYLIVNHLWRVLFHNKAAAEKRGPALWLSTAWKVALTYLAVVIGQVFFRASSFSDALAMISSMAGAHAMPLPEQSGLNTRATAEALIPTFAFVWAAPNVLQIFAPWKPTLSEAHNAGPKWFQALEWQPNMIWTVALGALAALAILGVAAQAEFLYFRF